MIVITTNGLNEVMAYGLYLKKIQVYVITSKQQAVIQKTWNQNAYMFRMSQIGHISETTLLTKKVIRVSWPEFQRPIDWSHHHSDFFARCQDARCFRQHIVLALIELPICLLSLPYIYNNLFVQGSFTIVLLFIRFISHVTFLFFILLVYVFSFGKLHKIVSASFKIVQIHKIFSLQCIYALLSFISYYTSR